MGWGLKAERGVARSRTPAVCLVAPIAAVVVAIAVVEVKDAVTSLVTFELRRSARQLVESCNHGNGGNRSAGDVKSPVHIIITINIPACASHRILNYTARLAFLVIISADKERLRSDN